MARTAKTDLSSPTARRRLKPRVKPYTTTVAARKLLGYIKPAAGVGRWIGVQEIGRTDTGAALTRRKKIGLADDIGTATTPEFINFESAWRAVSAWDYETGTADGFDVRRAATAYIDGKRASDGEAVAYESARRIRHCIFREDAKGKPLPGARGLADRPVNALTLGELRVWRDAMVVGEHGVKRSTGNRTVAVLKALLNHAFRDEKNGIVSDNAWRRLEKFEDADTPREDHFSAVQMERLIRTTRKDDAATADLLESVFHTAGRFKEMYLLDVKNLNKSDGTLQITGGKTGARLVQLTREGTQFFAGLAKNRTPDAPLLLSPFGGRWEPSAQLRPVKRAMLRAKLPATSVLYSVRHSAISIAILRGQPLPIVAKNSGTSLEMLERFYFKVVDKVRRGIIEKTGATLRT